MDWFSAWEPVPYLDPERVDVTSDGGALTAWLVLSVIVLAALVAWWRQRVARYRFWCATAGREVEMRFQRGCVLSCSVFGDESAIACARRCVDRSFRVQWPPALPLVTRGSVSRSV